MVLILLWCLFFGGAAQADPDATRDAFDRLEEILELRIDDGLLRKEDLSPALLVSARPRYVDTEGWFGARAIEVLQNTLGEGSLRLCEACMAPRMIVQDGVMVYQAGPVTIDEIVRLDDQLRGESEPARVAVYIDETAYGLAVKIVDLRTGAVRYAGNVDPNLFENESSHRTYKQAAELERRARGDSVTQVFIDAGLFPGQHISVDWSDQWGKYNCHLTGVTLSIFDPILGLGANYAYVTPLLNTAVGGKLILSLPTGLVRAVGNQQGPTEVIDPLITAVLTVRVPIGRSNYGVLATVSTNGQFTLGISLLNISPLPILP